MDEPRKGRQTPTQSVVLPYSETYGQEAIDLYNSTGRTAQEWQELLTFDILAINNEGLWVHTKFGYSVPRRNGKNEVVAIREFYGLEHGERILHTAHRTTTSAAASRRLAALLDAAGYIEVTRLKKGETYDKHYTYSKQMGLERIVILGEGGGTIDFRTRSSKGGLGEGFDLLVIDEAQEYTDDQESALKYVVTDSRNPQTLFCGTPPTTVSSGTVFLKMRNAALQGETVNTGWAEWSVETMTDPRDKEAWYETNPSLGTIFTERSVLDEVGSDSVDFNIQRLGLWLRYNQKSAISKAEWEELQVQTLPKLTGKLTVGIKYAKDGDSVAMSVAVRTADGSIFVEAIDCRPIRAGNEWILSFLDAADVESVVVDGANGQQLLADNMKQRKLKAPILPSVNQIILANSTFVMEGMTNRRLCHMGQPSLVQVISNCEKRAIGSNGGFGYKSILDGAKIELMESMILAFWKCNEKKVKRKQQITY
jgi:phage terminase large subunit-like protein